MIINQSVSPGGGHQPLSVVIQFIAVSRIFLSKRGCTIKQDIPGFIAVERRQSMAYDTNKKPFTSPPPIPHNDLS
jgi:hypothetical protein